MSTSALGISAYGRTTIGDKVGLLFLGIPSVFARVFFALIGASLRGKAGNRRFLKHVYFSVLKFVLSWFNVRQVQAVIPFTDKEYLNLASRQKFVPESVTLPSGVKAHWIGKSSAKRVLLYFHGGGYELPCSTGHFDWMYSTQKGLEKAGHDVSILMLAYTVTPYGVYPTQLKQAVEVTKWLVETKGTSPSDIIVGGDSAGGNLTVGLLSYLNHGHHDIAPWKLPEPFRAAVLISPWVDFSNNAESFKTNASADMLDANFSGRAAKAFQKGTGSDYYNEPATAPATFWNGLDLTVKSILVWGGGAEVLIDSIKRFTLEIQSGHEDVSYIETPNVEHEAMIFDSALHYPKQPYQIELEQWIGSKL